MPPVTVRLLGARRFAPLFATQFLGAFNDNLYRTAMTFLIVFHLKASDPAAGAALATVAAGLFILPYFLFSALAGQLADVRDKAVDSARTEGSFGPCGGLGRRRRASLNRFMAVLPGR